MITKEQLAKIVSEIDDKFTEEMEYYSSLDFAHALIKRIEQEAEVVGTFWVEQGADREEWGVCVATGARFEDGTKIIALPLVSDSEEGD